MPDIVSLSEVPAMSKPPEIETAEYEVLISPSAGETSQAKPASTDVRVEVGAVTHTGRIRSRNEDHYLVSRVSRQQQILQTNMPPDSLPAYTGEDGYLFIVADGMGGMAAGEVASRLAISTSLKLFQRSERWGFRVNRRVARELFERLTADLREIDRTLTEKSAADRRLLGMGTTLTAAYSMGIDLFIVHLGDSRVYLYRGGVLKQLTKDHTVAQAMADAGYIAADEVRRHVKRNALTNFLGGHHGKVKADLRWLRLNDGDRLLLCSDGLNEMVDDASIARILSGQDDARAAAQQLLEEALNHGGKDNVTVIVAQYRVTDGERARTDPAIVEFGVPLESTTDTRRSRRGGNRS
jgi:PPM family protein phosphatase